MDNKHGGKRPGAGRKYKIFAIREGKPVLIDGSLHVVQLVEKDRVTLTCVKTGQSLEIKTYEGSQR